MGKLNVISAKKITEEHFCKRLGGHPIPEPLKPKKKLKMSTAEYVGRLVTEVPFKEGHGKIIEFYKTEDIKSAVEYLKEDTLKLIHDIKKNGTKSDKISCLNSFYAETLNNINKAFADVLEPKE